MKVIPLFPRILVFLAVLLMACTREDSLQSTGFNCTFSETATGYDQFQRVSTGKVSVTWSANLEKASLVMFLVNPQQDTVWKVRLAQPGYHSFSSDIDGGQGLWSLGYKSLSGKGALNLKVMY